MHETAGLQRVDHAVGVDAADLCELLAADRLLIRNDRERLERRLRQSRLLDGEHEPLHVRGDVRMRVHPPSATDLTKNNAPLRRFVLGLHLFERAEHHIARSFRYLRELG